MKVKVFSTSSPASLESEINKWIKVHKGIYRVVSIQLSESSTFSNTTQDGPTVWYSHTALITYENEYK